MKPCALRAGSARWPAGPRNVFRQKFQRNIPAEPRVYGFIDDAHASAAKFFQDGVMGDRTAED